MKKCIINKINEKHFDTITDIIIKQYEKDPMNFIFIGPSSFYIKEIAENIAKKHNKTINRDCFKVINQYITELMKFYQPNSIILDREFLKIFIENEIQELIDKEKSEDKYNEYLQLISKSKHSVEYLLDIFEKKWELKQTDEEVILDYFFNYKQIDSVIDVNSELYRLYSSLEEKLEKLLNTKFDDSIKYNNNFDYISVYKWFYKELPEILKKEKRDYVGKTLVIGGFFDLSPIICKVFEVLFNSFEDVIFHIWEKVDDRAFETLDFIYEFLNKNNFEIYTQKNHIKDLFNKKSFHILRTTDPITEIELISKEIKKKIINENYSPKDFGIVFSDSSQAKKLSDFLKAIKVPYRYKNDIPLSKSKIVNLIMQPLKTIVKGYEVEDILSTIELGFIGELNITIEEIEKYLINLNLMYDEQKSNLKSRKKKWLTTIKNEMIYLEKNISITDEYERLEKELKQLKEIYSIFKSIFDFFYDLEYFSDKKKRKFNISVLYSFIRKWIKDEVINIKILNNYIKNDDYNLKSEYNALVYFENLMVKIENTLEKLNENKNEMKLDKFYNILSNIIEVETYRESEKYENSVELMNLVDSRFVLKKLKYYLGFQDKYYPYIKTNPFINAISDNLNESYRYSEKLCRRNMFISFIFSEKIILSCPISNISGEMILSSVYEKEIINLFDVKIMNYKENKKEVIPKSPEDVFSMNEAILYYVVNKNDYSDNTVIENITQEISKFKNYIDNNKWTFDEKTQINNLSHTRISTYIDCPFKYFLSVVLNIKGDKDFKRFDSGLIKHSVMKILFDKHPYYKDVDNLLLNEEQMKILLKNTIYKVWDEKIIGGLEKYNLIKNIIIETIIIELLEAIEEINSNYIQIRKKDLLKYEKVLEKELSLSNKIKINNHEFRLNTKLDRLDLLNGDYIYKSDSFDNNIAESSYCILDYKNNADNVQSEQLLIYYLALGSDDKWGKEFKEKSIYLKFQPLKLKKSKGKTQSYGNKFIKIQKDNIIILQKKSQTKFVEIPFDEFLYWLEELLNNINNSVFIPIAKEKRKLERFFKYMEEKYNCRNSSEKYYECNYCEYISLCEALEYLKDFKVKEINYKL